MWAVLARARGWWTALAVTLVALVVAALGPGGLLPLPAQGERRVAHVVVATYPVLISGILAERLPSLARTLPRERALWRASLVAYWMLVGGVAGLTLAVEPLSRHDAAYLYCWTIVLGSVCSVVVRRWPQAGTLLGASLGIGWLVVAESLAPLMGFPLFPVGPGSDELSRRLPGACWGWVVAGVACAGLLWWRDPEPGAP